MKHIGISQISISRAKFILLINEGHPPVAVAVRGGERNCFLESVPVRRVRRDSYNRSIGSEEATVRNREDLSGTAGRRAAPPGS